METLYIGVASGVISFTVAEMKIFEWLREFLNRKSVFLGGLIHCFFCLSFWISAVIYLIYQPNLINRISVVDEIVTYFIVCGISGFVGLIFKCLFRVADGI